MKKTSKIIIGIIVLAVVFWGGVKLLGTKDEKTKEPIKIGAILPLTGPASFVGEGMSYAIQIAAEEINRQGGIGGREIQLILENSMSEGKTAVSAIQKLINVDKIDLLIGGSTYEMMAISPIAEQNKIPIITPCSSKPMVTENNNYVFRLMASDSIQANWAANVSYNFLKKRKWQ